MKAIGSIIGIIFGIFWTISVATMGAPVFFPLFGIVFIIMGCANFYYNYKNATGKNRFSEFDIVNKDEEIDPLEKHFNYTNDKSDFAKQNESKGEFNYCPYCGKSLESEFEFCPKCGKKV